MPNETRAKARSVAAVGKAVSCLNEKRARDGFEYSRSHRATVTQKHPAPRNNPLRQSIWPGIVVAFCNAARERSPDFMATPTEQPPRKLSGKRTAQQEHLESGARHGVVV
jgi:hypothetical protein